MVSTAPQVWFSLTANAVNGGLRTSPVDSSISSGAMGTIINKKHPTRPRLPTPSVGIIAARLMGFGPEKDR